MIATAVVCRGCCCGSLDKHPTVDHAAQLEALESVAHVVRSACLDVCEHSNVIAVLTGSGVTWLGGVVSERQTSAVVEWLGGSGIRTSPDEIAEMEFDPPGAASARLEAILRRLERAG